MDITTSSSIYKYIYICYMYVLSVPPISEPPTQDREDGPWRIRRQDSDDEFGQGSEEEHQAAGGDAAAPEAAGEPPQNKVELQELRDQYENTMALVTHLYHDTSLRDQFRMVSIGTRSYLDEYSDTLEKQKVSQDRG